MIKSSKPRYQRRFRYNAPMHIRQKFVHAHVDKELRNKLKLPRAIEISKGDTVKIKVGKFKGNTGTVSSVNLKTGKIIINGIVRKNSKGKEIGIPIPTSNVYITNLNLSDKIRAQKLKQAQVIENEKRKEEKNIKDINVQNADQGKKEDIKNTAEKAVNYNNK
ncbi:MAG: 50S ribosomal protein L24 [Candidatus Micrarchaeia archaeon]